MKKVDTDGLLNTVDDINKQHIRDLENSLHRATIIVYAYEDEIDQQRLNAEQAERSYREATATINKFAAENARLRTQLTAAQSVCEALRALRSNHTEESADPLADAIVEAYNAWIALAHPELVEQAAEPAKEPA